MNMFTIDPKNTETSIFHKYLLGSVTPRPIALASTLDLKGNVNLSPFSFFNCFGANPPILVFSPARRVRGNTTKHTLENIMETKEVVIHIVNYAMVEQVSLASIEFEKGVNEFIKAGFTQTKSVKVAPPRVLEAPIAFECKVNDVIHLGEDGGAGNLIICEVVLAHFNETVLDKNNMVSPHKLDAVARMGGNWYCRVNSDNIFELPKPNAKSAVGFESLPESFLKSHVLSGNHLARLALVEKIPELIEDENDDIMMQIHDFHEISRGDKHLYDTHAHKKVSEYVENNQIELAWKFMILSERYMKHKLS